MIHKTAIIDSQAELGEGVSVGPFAVIGPQVKIGDGTKIDAHVLINGPTEIGKRCNIFPYACIGGAPQDLKYKGGETRIVIGDDNIIREYVTINRGTEEGGGLTSIGNRNFFMAYVHIAHDCTIQNQVIMANAATLAGHIAIDENAIIGGLVAVHQFVKVGRNAFIGGCSAVAKDVAPYCLVVGNRARLYGLNLTGLKRHNFTPQTVQKIKKAFQIIFRSGFTLKEATEKIHQEITDSSEVDHLLEFIKKSDRGIIR